MHSSILFNALFVLAVTLIWFMLAYQSVLFFLGHLYYRASRRAANERSKMPDSELPPVSVIVPCHNEELVIARTLHALLALDYPAEKVEFLIVNDGSSDATAAAVQPFTADPRVRLLEVPEALAAQGKAGALNYALRQAASPVLAIYDADNTPEPTALRPLVEELVRDQRLGAAIGLYRAVNRRRNLLTRFLNIEGIGFQWIVQAGRWRLLRFVSLPGTNYVIRRQLVESLGGWDRNALTEDAELTLRVYQAGYLVKFVPASVSWEQEPETLAVWFRQRNRWVRGYNYLFRKYAGTLLRARPHRIGWELLYSLSLYYVFFLATVISDVLFLLSASGLVRITVPGPYSLVWLFAFFTFVLQIVVALSCERGEDTPINILLTIAMYVTYCQLWIPVVASALYDDFIARRPAKWVKTERFEVG
ncbi:MAG: glycosyl transferase family 2 [Acidobacteria bacterium]|nr:MAG: glycosyl transferase family 2 [Acidobacteriota bacterium]